MTFKKKLIEVALPLEAINREAAREKSIRHGHPSSLHLWWARRPLAACRAMLFAALVDDPSAHPDKFPTDEDQQEERGRLFALLEELVKWENASNSVVLRAAEHEIRASIGEDLPPVVDPFAGGGAIPIEAQRLGIPVVASDLNPVAVLINDALTRIPQRWQDRDSITGSFGARLDLHGQGTSGLAQDVRHYAEWMLTQARERLASLYPLAKMPDNSTAHVIAWIWARTVQCPNPACRRRIPIARSFWLSKNKGKEAWLRPVAVEDGIEFEIDNGKAGPPDGNMSRSGATCMACSSNAAVDYLRAEGISGRLGQQLVAVVAEGKRGRVYLPSSSDHVDAASVERPVDVPEGALSTHPQYMGTPRYGLTTFADLFTNRQLRALSTFSDLVEEARLRIHDDASAAGWPAEEAEEYASDLAVYLAFFVSKLADLGNSLCRWEPIAQCPRQLFARQAISMVWDFAEGNPIGRSSGSWQVLIDNTIRSFGSPAFPRTNVASADVRQLDATSSAAIPPGSIVSTDPPYYDNVPYSDISDFFYVWMRRTLRQSRPNFVSTLLTPKAEELVADMMRHGGKDEARRFFEEGFAKFCRNVHANATPDVPVSIFYAFKQTEGSGDDQSVASTGWETMLEGLIRSGFVINGTWPIRTEMGSRMRGQASNALASSIVLSCRKRAEGAPLATRKEMLEAIREELPVALRTLQEGNVAPVDLAQAAIGPGMAVFSRYSKIIEADGSSMRIRTALELINQVLSEVLSQQEDEFDSATRWAIAWFEQYGTKEGPYGEADVLARAKGVAVNGLKQDGLVLSGQGKVRLLRIGEWPPDWDPMKDQRLRVWEVTHHLVQELSEGGEESAAAILRKVGESYGHLARDLVYRLYNACERKKWTSEALSYNQLVVAWPEIQRLAGRAESPQQQVLG